MSDDRLRAAERAWREARDLASEVRYLRERSRAGRLDEQALALAALLGHAAAREVLGSDPAAGHDLVTWVDLVVAGTLAMPDREPALRVALAATFAMRVPWADRFDGPDDHAVRALDALEDMAFAAAAARGPLAHRAREVATSAAQAAWGAEAVANVVFPACGLALEAENAVVLLRDVLATAAGSAGDDLRGALAGDVGPWLLGLGDPAAERRTRRGRRFGAEPDLVRAIAFSPDGARVAVGCRTGVVTLRDALTGAPLLELERAGQEAFAVAWSRNGHLLRGGLKGDLALFSPSGELAVTWPAHAQGVTDAAWLFDGRIASVGYDGALRVWLPPFGSGPARPDVPGDGRRRVVDASPDRPFVVTGSNDGHVTRWDLPAGTPRWTARASERGVNGLQVEPDGRHALIGSDDGWLRRLNVNDGREVGSARVDERDLYALAVSPRGDLAATAHSDAVRLARLPDLAVVREWATPGVRLAVAFAPDGTWLLSGARSGALRRHDVS